MRWNEEQTVTFVKIYLQHDYLWNKKHERYGQKYLRKKAYQDISSLFEDATGIKLMEREVMIKIKNLSSTYAQELAKMKKYSETDHPYKSSLKWFQYWYRCKHGDQLISDDSQCTSEDQKMWLELTEGEHNYSVSQIKNNEIESSPTRRWCEDETVKFVKIYLQHNILWNSKHAYYRKNKLRKKAYREICSEFNKATGIALTEKEVLMKIRSLKSTYCQELLKIRRLSRPNFKFVSPLKWFADWDWCYNNAKYSNQTETGLESDSKHLVEWLELSNDEGQATPSKQNEESLIKPRWNEAVTMKFVKIFLQYEFLYDPKHKYFRDKKLRHEGYSSVISEFKAATGIMLEESELKSKVRNLSSTYAQELAKIKCGSDTDIPYTPTIKWFRLWHKHKYTVRQRNGQITDNDTQEHEALVSAFEEQMSDEEEHKFEPESEEHPHSESDCEVETKRKKEMPEEEPDSVNQLFFVDANSSPKDDEFEHYGKYVASVLRNMELDKALQVQLEIQNLLSKSMEGGYRRKT
ncbi:uncharacterized protein LOC128675678 [Plodia interpunctella]|uniref:uncharacterized protein LOC128675678 n=1 Tax=Plodia interpunctella TaxID=58824 RepID=UPI002368EF76|nr:uncharacterized protein LOC128675678 [Plodia interpunctella]XP_053611219.1 uncharacterized protein LOC128675678 [Plodia interpunctella]